MYLTVLFLILGLAMIIKGGDLFVSSSVRIAEFLRLPRIVIGSTLVSLATTSPELVVSIMAGLRSESGLAVGNAVGSCICNTALILGTIAAMREITVHPSALRVPILAMVAAALLLLFLTLDLSVSRVQGWMLLIIGTAYFVYDFIRHKRESLPHEAAEAAQIEREATRGYAWLQTPGGTTIQFIAGALLVVIGSRILVDSAVTIAQALGVPSIVIGLTVVAVGTSLPELVTAVTSSRKNVSDLAIGNILGANVANLTLIVGSAGALNEVTMSRAVQLYNFPTLLILLVVLSVSMMTRKRVTRAEGWVLLTIYSAYIAGLVVMTLRDRS